MAETPIRHIRIPRKLLDAVASRLQLPDASNSEIVLSALLTIAHKETDVYGFPVGRDAKRIIKQFYKD